MAFDISLVLVPLVAVLAPLLSRGIAPWLPVPVVVFELLVGILIGPYVLGWAVASDFLVAVSQFGLAMLFFVAGTEIDIAGIRGRPLRRSTLGWIVSIALGVGIGMLVTPGAGAVVIAIALSSTAFGTILPILRDAGEMRTPFGLSASALGAVGEFGPLIAISILLGTRSWDASTLVLAAFLALTALAIFLGAKLPQGRLHAVVRATLHTSGQFAIRIVMLVLTALVALSIWLDLDILLGAFAAGLLFKVLMRDAPEEEREGVESKIEAVSFGFLVPVFFIVTGMTFNVEALMSPVALALLPLFLVALLLTRGLPAQLAAPPGSSARDRVGLGLLAATGLPIIVAVTAIGTSEDLISEGVASALVGAGMLSVLIYPLLAMIVRREKVANLPAPVRDDEA